MADKVVLAYSGGLDTSVAIRWMREKYGLDTIAVNISVGKERDFSAIRQKALDVGAIKALVIDAKDTFIEEYVFSISVESSIAARDVVGGTAPKRVQQALTAAKKIIEDARRGK